MALSTVQADLINKSSPVHNEYDIGDRLAYRTFEMDIKTAVGATGSSYFASNTGDQMADGVYTLSTKTVHRISSAQTAGDRIICWNPTTGTTMDVMFSSNGGVTVHDTGDCVVALEPQEVLNTIAISTAKWVILNSSAGFKTAFTSST